MLLFVDIKNKIKMIIHFVPWIWSDIDWEPDQPSIGQHKTYDLLNGIFPFRDKETIICSILFYQLFIIVHINREQYSDLRWKKRRRKRHQGGRRCMTSIFLVSLHVCIWLPYLLFVFSFRRLGGVGSQESQLPATVRGNCSTTHTCTPNR